MLVGFGGLSLSIEGPSKAEIQCNDKEDGTLNISYKPTEPGYYIVNLKFADHHVEGSPFTVKVCICLINKRFTIVDTNRYNLFSRLAVKVLIGKEKKFNDNVKLFLLLK